MDFIRLMLVLACMAPLFILMAIRGIGLVPWEIYFPSFLALAIIPNLYLVARIWIAIRNNDRKIIRVINSTDNREQLITYVFAMLPCASSSRMVRGAHRWVQCFTTNSESSVSPPAGYNAPRLRRIYVRSVPESDTAANRPSPPACSNRRANYDRSPAWDQPLPAAPMP